MVLGQYRAVLVGTWWYWVRIGRYCLPGVICFQKIYGLHGVKHQIIEYSKKETVMTDRQTHRQTEFPLVDSTPSVEGVE